MFKMSYRFQPYHSNLLSQNRLIQIQTYYHVLEVWGEWGEWSSCSHTCDSGTQTRSRSSSIGNPDDTEEQACTGLSACPGIIYFLLFYQIVQRNNEESVLFASFSAISTNPKQTSIEYFHIHTHTNISTFFFLHDFNFIHSSYYLYQLHY